MPERRANKDLAGVVLKPVLSESDILPQYRDGPIGELIAAHNLGHAVDVGSVPDLLVITCMDYRVTLRIPARFAFQIRTAGATPVPVLPTVAFATAIARTECIAIIGHTDCAMCRIRETREVVIDALVSHHRWPIDEARSYVNALEADFALDDPVEATLRHSRPAGGALPVLPGRTAPLLRR